MIASVIASPQAAMNHHDDQCKTLVAYSPKAFGTVNTCSRFVHSDNGCPEAYDQARDSMLAQIGKRAIACYDIFVNGVCKLKQRG